MYTVNVDYVKNKVTMRIQSRIGGIDLFLLLWRCCAK